MCLRLVGLNNYFYGVFLTKNELKKKGIWKIIVIVNIASMITFTCCKILFHVLRYEKKG